MKGWNGKIQTDVLKDVIAKIPIDALKDGIEKIMQEISPL